MNIYIANIPASITEHELTELFAVYGEVKNIRLVQDKHTGLANGNAYIIMDSYEEAERAIASLNGSEYRGYTLQVQHADAADFPTGDFW